VYTKLPITALLCGFNVVIKAAAAEFICHEKNIQRIGVAARKD